MLSYNLKIPPSQILLMRCKLYSQLIIVYRLNVLEYIQHIERHEETILNSGNQGTVETEIKKIKAIERSKVGTKEDRIRKILVHKLNISNK
jgi:hypothetical protein